MSTIPISQADLAVLNFDENFAVGTRTLFASNGLDQIFSVPGDDTQQAATAGEIVFETGASLDKNYVPAYHAANPLSDGVVDDAYAATLTVNLRTPRAVGNTPALTAGILDRHNEICATIRGILQTHRNPYDSIGAAFPYYAVKFIRPVGTRHYADQDFEQDVSTLIFALEFAILPTAWVP